MYFVDRLLKDYADLKIQDALHYEKFNRYSFVYNSCAIEGSTLTEQDTILLLDEDIVSPKSSFHDHLMAMDHYQALLFVEAKAKERAPITLSFIQEIASLVMKNTGVIRNPGGVGMTNESKGDLRKVSVSAGSGGKPYMDPKSIPQAMDKFCSGLQDQMTKVETVEERLQLSFDAHFDFESIHPFTDGNGRTGRLVMVYIQLYFGLPPLIISNYWKSEYIQALIDSRNDRNDLMPIRSFLFKQYSWKILQEIKRFEEFS